MKDSGKLTFTDDRLHYESAVYGSWRLDAASIRLIGEFTNQSGPFSDDYFFAFFRRGEDDWYSASFYCDGWDIVWEALTVRFPGLAQPGLANSADFRSRVVWPVSAVGKQLFDFRPMKRGERLRDRLLDRVLPPFVVESVLRTEFKEGPDQPPEPKAMTVAHL